MNRHQLRSLYEILSTEDTKIIRQIRNKGQIKRFGGVMLSSIVITILIIPIIFLVEDPVLAVIGSMSPLLGLVAYIILVAGPKAQIKIWIGWFEAKSIVYETPDFNGFKSAIDDYISRDKNYYTDERSIDRRAVEKINN